MGRHAASRPALAHSAGCGKDRAAATDAAARALRCQAVTLGLLCTREQAPIMMPPHLGRLQPPAGSAAPQPWAPARIEGSRGPHSRQPAAHASADTTEELVLAQRSPATAYVHKYTS